MVTRFAEGHEIFQASLGAASQKKFENLFVKLKFQEMF